MLSHWATRRAPEERLLTHRNLIREQCMLGSTVVFIQGHKVTLSACFNAIPETFVGESMTKPLNDLSFHCIDCALAGSQDVPKQRDPTMRVGEGSSG